MRRKACNLDSEFLEAIIIFRCTSSRLYKAVHSSLHDDKTCLLLAVCCIADVVLCNFSELVLAIDAEDLLFLNQTEDSYMHHVVDVFEVGWVRFSQDVVG